MKKVIYSALVALTMVLMLSSCGSTKNVAYFQNADQVSLAASKMLYDAKIMPKDELTIPFLLPIQRLQCLSTLLSPRPLVWKDS